MENIGTDNRLTEAAHWLVEAQDNLREAVEWARSKGYTWSDIAAVLGVSRQAAQQRFGYRESR